MDKPFDLVVIGTGSAASTVATRCRAAGWRVAVVDSQPFGGTCALRGCDPKKILVGAAEALDAIRRLDGKGIQPDNARIEWSRLMAFKRAMIADVPASRERNFATHGIEMFHGRAAFMSGNALSVGADRLEARYFVVAAGARPVDLRIPGGEHVVTSDQFLDLDELPRRVVFVGGGYISFEFGHVAARAGARVTILHRGAHPLGSFDPDLVDLLVSRTERLGITLRLQTEVTGIEPAQPGFRVHLSGGGQRDAVDADLVVHGAGRTADLRDLTLTAAGVDWSSRGVAVNDYLQSVSNPAVYAAGDAAATDAPKLTPVAAHHGRVVSSNLLEGNHRKPDHSVVPSVVFTVPALASVGLHERTVRDRDLHFTVHREDTHAWYSSRRVGETASGFKVLVEEGSGRILGAHLLGPSADEVINLFAMAMRAGMPASAIKEILYAYPTGGSDVSHMV